MSILHKCSQMHKQTHSLTSKSPTSKDQISSLFSTFQTLIKPLMSAVATKEESWLNTAQVTESLWPVGNIKREQLLSSVMPVWKTIYSFGGRRKNEIARI